MLLQYSVNYLPLIVLIKYYTRKSLYDFSLICKKLVHSYETLTQSEIVFLVVFSSKIPPNLLFKCIINTIGHLDRNQEPMLACTQLYTALWDVSCMSIKELIKSCLSFSQELKNVKLPLFKTIS